MNYNQDPIESALKISRINSAQFMNIALHELWKEARNHSRAGLFNKWNQDLDMIWGELGGDLEEKDKKFQEYKEINDGLHQLGSLSSPEIQGFKSRAINPELRGKQYVLLLKKHLWLKKLQNELGKGTAYKDPFEYDFE